MLARGGGLLAGQREEPEPRALDRDEHAGRADRGRSGAQFMALTLDYGWTRSCRHVGRQR